jgi:pimeloyl-ACP methyl ester carboxylesterase
VRARCLSTVVLAAILVFVLAATAALAAPGVTRPGVVRYATPVPGAVIQAFDAPASAFGAGHRGVDLAAAAMEGVRAAGDGRVSFSGAVAGQAWVSIEHADGVTTSYGPLTGVLVRAGEEVARAQVIGRLAPEGHGHERLDTGLHWGARVEAGYIDPLGLLDRGLPRPSLIGAGTWKATDPTVFPYEPWSGGRLWGLGTSGSPAASRPGFSYAPNPNHLVLLAGFGTTSEDRVLDPTHLGYDLRSVTNFSYAGRHDGDGAADDPRRDQLPYGSADTWEGPRHAAALLADQLREQARREPGRAVDLVGHSMGGIVILHYLLEHHDAYDITLPPIGHVVTVASPIDGSDAATIGGVIDDTLLVGPVIGFLQERGLLFADHRLAAPAVGELAVGSEMLWELAVAWEQAIDDGTAGALATGTRVLNIGGSRDLVVSSARTRQPATFTLDGAAYDVGVGSKTGQPGEFSIEVAGPRGPTAEIDGQQMVDHRVLPGGHSSVLETEALREVTWRFLAGQEVIDSPGHLSRVVGGDLAAAAGQGAEIYSLYGPLRKVGRNLDRLRPLDLDHDLAPAGDVNRDVERPEEASGD